MKTFVFQFKDVDGAMEFYRRCELYKLDTQKERELMLVQMAKEGYMERVSMTGRSKDQVIEDWSKHSKILDMTNPEEPIQ